MSRRHIRAVRHRRSCHNIVTHLRRSIADAGDGDCARAASGKASTDKPAAATASAKAAAATTVRTLRARPAVNPLPGSGATWNGRSLPVSLVRGGDPAREDRAEEDRPGGAPLRNKLSRGMTRPGGHDEGSRLSAERLCSVVSQTFAPRAGEGFRRVGNPASPKDLRIFCPSASSL